MPDRDPSAIPGSGPKEVLRPPVGVVRARVPLTAAYRSRDFTIFWLGALVSNAGTWLQNITIPFVLFEITDSETWVGLSTFSLFLPIMIMGPAGGALADRRDRRKVLLVTQSVLAVVGLTMWAVWASGSRSPVLILALTAATGFVNGLNIPSWQAFVPGLVPKEHLTSAITLNSLQFNAARAIGPAIGGVILATLGPSWAFLLNGISFTAVLAALAVVRARYERPRRSRTGERVLREFRTALGYVRQKRGIIVGISVAIVVGFFGNPIIQFTVVFAEDVFDRGPAGVGLLSASLGIGSVVAAVLVGGGRWLRSTLTRVALVCYGCAVVAFGLSPSIATAAIALVVAGGGFLTAITVSNTAVQMIVSEDMRGRVMAARVMSFTAAYPIGGLLQGFLAESIGPRTVVTAAGCMLLVAAAILASRPGLLQSLDEENTEDD